MKERGGMAVVALFCWSLCLWAMPDREAWINVKDFGASGSAFETTASTTADSHKIVVKDMGDFRVGQQVMLSKCYIHYEDSRLRGPGSPYREWKKLEGEVEVHGFDGSADGWLPILIDIDGVDPVTFRWTGDVGKTWKTKVPVTGDWQDLTAGIQVRFRKDGWKLGHVVQFVARAQLVSTIEKIEGNALWLGTAPNRTVKDAVVRHCDTAVLQAIVKRAIAEKKNVFFPNGRYRLSEGMLVQDAAIRIEGESAEHTVMDITQGLGPVFRLRYGDRVTLRNFRMIGHGSRAAGHGAMRTSAGFSFWCMALKSCKAVHIEGTRHVLIENVHASQMASECFYSQGPYRKGREPRENCTESITYLRCWVEDCAHNAFNNNDAAEGTSVLYCRAENVGAYAYEGPGRFIRIVGNYARDCGGGFVVGNMEGRHEHFRELGCGQAVITGNVLEGTFSSRAGVDITRGAGQVVVADNLFINLNGDAIRAADRKSTAGFPARGIVIKGNIVDMTHLGAKARSRTGIEVSSPDGTISDNQVYVRGPADPRVTGICLREPGLNLTVANNLVRNCACGIRTDKAEARVTEVIDPATFLQDGLQIGLAGSQLYRGWRIAWLKAGNLTGVSTVESVDSETRHFRLAEPRAMQVGEGFVICPPSNNWNIHDNTVTGCTSPVVLDACGSATNFFQDNILTRGQADGVEQAVTVSGRVNLLRNHVSGFDEPDCAALLLQPDVWGKAPGNVYRDNIFDRCATTVKEARDGLWAACNKDGNVFVDCGNTSKESDKK